MSDSPGRLGRLAPHPESTHPRLKLYDFLTAGYSGNVPSAVDYLSKIRSWPVYANDRIGDCTTAAAGHMEAAWSAYGQGTEVDVTVSDVVSMYSAVTGYNPANPASDRGAVMQDVLNYWRKVGLAGHRIAAFAQLDHTDLTQVKAALYLFGGIYVGVNFPQSGFAQFSSGRPWDYVATADNTIAGGHCVHLGLDNNGQLMCTTWGRTQQITSAWWNCGLFVEEAWVPLSLEWMRNNTSPEGLDTVALNAAFRQMTGQPGPFPVAPAPPSPTPVPPTPPPSPTPVPVSAADQTLAAAIPRNWIDHPHLRFRDANTVADALKAWLISTGQL